MVEGNTSLTPVMMPRAIANPIGMVGMNRPAGFLLLFTAPRIVSTRIPRIEGL